MSLVITRRPGECFVMIDKNDPAKFSVVKVAECTRGPVRLVISAPQSVHILRRELLSRYPVHDDVLDEVARMEAP